MKKSMTGTKSSWGAVRATPRRTLLPWGKPVPKRTVGATTGSGQGRNMGRKPAGSSVAKPTADKSLWGMQYKLNDPLGWPVESPASRSDLILASGMSQDKADFANAALNKAYQRGGYAG